MQLGGSTFGYLNAFSLEQSFAHLASVGLNVVELGLAAPHVDLDAIDTAQCRRIKQDFAAHGLHCVAVNAAELNLISQNSGVAALAVRQYCRAIEVAAEIGVETVVVVPGRQGTLRPVPHQVAMDIFLANLTKILQVADAHQITIALETTPFGFLQTAGELRDVIERIGNPNLRIVVDSSNMLMVENPAVGVRQAGNLIAVSHVSDAWTTKWAHTSIGDGDVDFAAFRSALEAAGYEGVTIYELMDGEDPVPRLANDLKQLQSLGWRL